MNQDTDGAPTSPSPCDPISRNPSQPVPEGAAERLPIDPERERSMPNGLGAPNSVPDNSLLEAEVGSELPAPGTEHGPEQSVPEESTVARTGPGGPAPTPGSGTADSKGSDPVPASQDEAAKSVQPRRRRRKEFWRRNETWTATAAGGFVAAFIGLPEALSGITDLSGPGMLALLVSCSAAAALAVVLWGRDHHTSAAACALVIMVLVVACAMRGLVTQKTMDEAQATEGTDRPRVTTVSPTSPFPTSSTTSTAAPASEPSSNAETPPRTSSTTSTTEPASEPSPDGEVSSSSAFANQVVWRGDGSGSLCLESTSDLPNTEVRLASCRDDPAMRWSLANQRLRGGQADLCLARTETNNASAVRAVDCDPDSEMQTWREENGHIINDAPGVISYLDADAAGGAVHLNWREDDSTQLWSVRS